MANMMKKWKLQMMKVEHNPTKTKDEWKVFINIFGGTVGEDEYYIDGKCYTRTEYRRILKEKENIHWNYKTLSERKFDERCWFVNGKVYTTEEYEQLVAEKSEKLADNITSIITIISCLLLPILLFVLGGR